jgi:hypothetical protein
MNREDAIKAVDGAFDDGIRHLYSIFEQGLVTGQPLSELTEHFLKGLAFHCDAHGKTTAIVNDYFKGFKP